MANTSYMQVRALLARQELLNQRLHKRLARGIHDEISQKMTLLALQLSLAASEDSAPANWAAKCKGWPCDGTRTIGSGNQQRIATSDSR